MKVRVDLTIDVEADAWRDVFGVDDVRADVRQYVVSLIGGQLGDEDLLGPGYVVCRD